MKLDEIVQKTKCDFNGCKNFARYAIYFESDVKKRMNFCENCLNDIYITFAKTITPKCVEAPFKKKKKIS